ncbi:GNAT family N-acetyltransferase, partial [Corallococcus sp. CA053C]|uniref:GNAT family N-acetyltransferase n=1 Tax=Corallococcus sp. CA053C TaxID=2316732 RepID=UPI0034CFA13A
LLAAVARQAIDRNFGRVEWGVRTWNQDAMRLYERIGAVVMDDWRSCSLAGKSLMQLATPLE